MDIKRKLEGAVTVSVCTMTFNRFGVKKQIVFEADNGQEISIFSKSNSGKVVRMSQEEYMQLQDAEQHG